MDLEEAAPQYRILLRILNTDAINSNELFSKEV
jgi:hypothetical protein